MRTVVKISWVQFDEQITKSDETSTNNTAAMDEEDVETVGKREWVVFESSPTPIPTTPSKPPPLAKMDQSRDISCEDILDTPNIVEKNKGVKMVKESLQKSGDNLVEAVNKTIASLKESILKSGEASQRSPLIPSSNDTMSHISDEVVDLEFESEDENKLCDTPIKLFAGVSLFQATTLDTDSKSNTTDNASTTVNELSKDMLKPTCQSLVKNTLDDYPPSITNNSWEFWYRYPDRRKKIGSRKWLRVDLRVQGDVIFLSSSTKTAVEIRKEIHLHPFFVFTKPLPHKGDKNGKFHSVRLQYVKYKERRHFQR